MENNLFDITLTPSGKKIECAAKHSVLSAGLSFGLAMRYQCSNGTCGVCTAQLVNGEIEKIKHHDFSLAKFKNNLFLSCCYAPKSDLEIVVNLIDDVKSIAQQRLTTK